MKDQRLHQCIRKVKSEWKKKAIKKNLTTICKRKTERKKGRTKVETKRGGKWGSLIDKELNVKKKERII